MTCAPSAANSFAVARPIPELAPVTSAILLISADIFLSICVMEGIWLLRDQHTPRFLLWNRLLTLHQPRRVEPVDPAELCEVRGQRAQIALRRHQLLEAEQLLGPDRHARERW